MVDGVECFFEVEVDYVLGVSFTRQTGYTFFLEDKVGQAGSTGKEAMLAR